MHIGPYDDEPATVTLMHEFMESQGYVLILRINGCIMKSISAMPGELLRKRERQ